MKQEASFDVPNYIVLSVDFELFSDTFAFQRLNVEWRYGQNGEGGVERILGLFEKYNVKSTFFVVARHAQANRELLHRIRDNGHEIASHTVNHIALLNCTSKEIEGEIKNSKKILEDVVDSEVVGFRAPTFGINSQIISTVAQGHYKYDSSVIPCRRIPGWYGFPNAPIYPFSIREIFPEMNSDIMEFPIAANPIIRMPISGAWMRLFGIMYTMQSIKSLLKRRVIPLLYVHPWEVIDLPRLKGIPWRVYYRTGQKTLNMMEHIIKNVDAKFVPIRDLLT